MRFAAPRDVDFVDPISRFRVRSTRANRTEVFDPAGNQLWSMRMFTEVFLIPNGFAGIDAMRAASAAHAGASSYL